ncbi:hypothetical protein KIN20_007348 [Parelaphostrongylus tenuis]|uniref:NTR domain-containing protein n=1 Tax=Parelaphostrongylus tenuis TaxID=148309 RepID=A0AAD5QJZ0_PARTN|nr:hypothetical protein KIN20_007348 [Parelaphostrongylus tenuis]
MAARKAGYNFEIQVGHMHESINFILLAHYAMFSLACQCAPQTSQESFCAADWVSHVRVRMRISKQPMPAGSPRKGLNNIRYAVKHLKIYKEPLNMIKPLPTDIYTPSEPAACGLILEAGREYLLAGRIYNGTLNTVLCGQVLIDNPSEELYENVLEWCKNDSRWPTAVSGQCCVFCQTNLEPVCYQFTDIGEMDGLGSYGYMIFSIAILLTNYVIFSSGCKCAQQTSQASFCAAEWVSHLKVMMRISKQPMPAGSPRKGLNNIRYAVKHLKIYKKPSNMTATLPTDIYTPSESAACGLIIEAGREYLLAGSVHNGTLYTVLCGQIMVDNPREELYENVLEWRKVPKELQEKLESSNVEYLCFK